MSPEQIIIAIACYIGVFAAAALPYIRKTDIATWDHRYTAVVALACIMSAITLESTILQYASTVNQFNGLLAPLFTAFMAGFGFQAGTAEAMKILQEMKTRWAPVKE
jgi:hypothetical protein